MTAIIASGTSAAPAQPRAKDSSGSGLVAALVFALFGSLLALGAAAAPSPAGGAPVPVGVFVLGGNAQDAMAIVTAANGRILANRIPHARLEVVEGGHLFLLTNPTEMAARINVIADTGEVMTTNSVIAIS